MLANESLLGAEWHYSNIECEALGIIHRLERFNHYHFAREVCILIYHKPLGAILSKDGHIFPAVAAYHAMHTTIQGVHYMQTWCRSVHHRLADQKQPNKRQRLGDHWHEYKCTAANIPVSTSLDDIQGA